MATLRFEDGTVQFRQRIVLSILSNRPILIRNIRNEDLDAPGLRQYEASFLRLIDQMTNGSRIEINSTGTQVRFFPGMLLGGRIEHVCPVASGSESSSDTTKNSNGGARSIGWFLEGILPLAPFGKDSLSIKFEGITDGACEVDPSVDYIRVSALPLLEQFGIGSAAEDADDILSSGACRIRVVRRGAQPLGGGEVEFFCPIVKELKPIDMVEEALVKRIRGTAISCKVVSTSMAARVAYSAKGVLHRLIPDVWIHTDAHSIKNHKCGPSPALSLILSAEYTNGAVLSSECCLDYDRSQQGRRELPEDLGKRGATMLLEEIKKGGVIDTHVQPLAFLLMCLTPEDVNRIRVGTLSEYSIGTLRLLKQTLGVEFKIKADHESNTVLLSCLGTGFRNLARAST